MTTATASSVYTAYTELLKRSLMNELNPENGLRISYLLECMDTSTPYDLDRVINATSHEQGKLDALAADPNGQGNYRERIFGFPFTMIGRARLDHLQRCVETVIEEGVPGDMLEAGVWRGGAVILMKAVADALGDTGRRFWVADSFRGVPPPTLEQDAGVDLYRDPCLAVPVEFVRAHFERFGVLDDRVEFLEGLFADTLPTAPVEQLSVLRADGDLYESTMDVLVSLYDKVSPGGFVIIDDYGALECCARATEDFRRERGITDPIERIDWTGAFWRKSG